MSKEFACAYYSLFLIYVLSSQRSGVWWLVPLLLLGARWVSPKHSQVNDTSGGILSIGPCSATDRGSPLLNLVGAYAPSVFLCRGPMLPLFVEPPLTPMNQ
jgi:hypothetical protein